MSFYQGQRVRMAATFKDENGAVTNPTTVACRLLSPAGTAETLATTNPSTGVFQAEKVVSAGGNWKVEFTSSGVVDTADMYTFYVRPDEVA